MVVHNLVLFGGLWRTSWTLHWFQFCDDLGFDCHYLSENKYIVIMQTARLALIIISLISGLDRTLGFVRTLGIGFYNKLV